MRIGIIGGSFDPIHFGHLIMAEYLREVKELDKIIFVPTGHAPHKSYCSDAETRLKMVDLAINNNVFFASSNIEVLSEKVSYTADTIKYLRNICPDPEFYFIIGLDNLFSLEKWFKIEELGQITKFLVANRIYKNDISLNDVLSKCKELKYKFKLDIEVIDTPLIEISSSNIRSRVKNGKSISYLTPRRVVDFILNEELYKQKECNENN